MLGKIFGMFKKDDRPDEDAVPDVPAEVEVDVIKHYLERKFGRKFRTRVKAEGYLGEEMEYRLVMDDHLTSEVGCSHSVWGNSASNVLDVNRAFVSGYWRGVSRGFASVGKNLSKWDKARAAEYMETAVAGSREEMLLRATAEGLI